MLPASYGLFFGKLKAAMEKEGFKPGDPVIDWTGHSPGILYAVQAQPLGQPWLLGGYPGSNRYALQALRRMPCSKLARAWVLLEPDGPRHLSLPLLKELGLDLTKDYRLVIELDTPAGSRGYDEAFRQELWRPVRGGEEAEVRCEKLRP
jgi:hypothetical protein